MPAPSRPREPEFARFAGRGIALALPEVPLAARRKLLALGAGHGFLRVASFTTAEILELAGELGDVDLLALNLDEAAALAKVSVDTGEPEAIVSAALAQIGPETMLTVTAGARGSWSWDGTTLAHLPALPVPVVSTAGAGDAHLAGTLVGLAAGLPLPASASARRAGRCGRDYITAHHPRSARLGRAAGLRGGC